MPTWLLSKPALAVYTTLAILLALWGYGEWKKQQGGDEVKTEVKIETLTTENKTLHKDISTRKRQNEILLLDITPSDFDNILRNGEF